MLDTIVLIIPMDEVQVADQSVFKSLFYERNKRVLNARAGEYAPRLTFSRAVRLGGYSEALKIEVSAPKLLFGNNFAEVVGTDYDAFIDRLQSKMASRGVSVSADTLRNAEPVGIHYSKNVVFDDATPCSLLIQTLSKLDVSRRFDFMDTNYKNGGDGIKWHTNSFELAFYDKVAELKAAKVSEKRSVERDSACQMDLLPRLLEHPELSVLRMEVRLNKRKKIKDALANAGYEGTFTLTDLFSEIPARAVLSYYWREFIKPSLGLVLVAEKSAEVLFYRLKAGNATTSEILKLLGAMELIKSAGVARLRTMLKPTQRRGITKALSVLNASDCYLHDHFRRVERAIDDQIPISSKYFILSRN